MEIEIALRKHERSSSTSMDTLILDTFEVTDMPMVALAAAEDFDDSEARILDVLKVIA